MTDYTPEPLRQPSAQPCNICGHCEQMFIEREFPRLSFWACGRCVACVDACAGIPTKQLKAGSVAALLNAIDEKLTIQEQGYIEAALAPFREG